MLDHLTLNTLNGERRRILEQLIDNFEKAKRTDLNERKYFKKPPKRFFKILATSITKVNDIMTLIINNIQNITELDHLTYAAIKTAIDDCGLSKSNSYLNTVLLQQKLTIRENRHG